MHRELLSILPVLTRWELQTLEKGRSYREETASADSGSVDRSAYDRCIVICRAELRRVLDVKCPTVKRVGSKQHRFQFKECGAQSFSGLF